MPSLVAARLPRWAAYFGAAKTSSRALTGSATHALPRSSTTSVACTVTPALLPRAVQDRAGGPRHPAERSNLVAGHYGQVDTTIPVKSTAWPLTVVDAEQVVSDTMMMSVAAGSHRHPSGPASGSVLQHTGGAASAAGSRLVARGLGLVGIAQSTIARSANRTPIEGRMAKIVSVTRRPIGRTLQEHTRRLRVWPMTIRPYRCMAP